MCLVHPVSRSSIDRRSADSNVSDTNRVSTHRNTVVGRREIRQHWQCQFQRANDLGQFDSVFKRFRRFYTSPQRGQFGCHCPRRLVK
jgi:hypothetical protein